MEHNIPDVASVAVTGRLNLPCCILYISLILRSVAALLRQ